MQICTFCVGDNRLISSDFWKAMSLLLCEQEYMCSKCVSWEKRKKLTQHFQRNFCHFQQSTIWLHHAQIQLFSQDFWKMKICSWSWHIELFNPHNVVPRLSLHYTLKLHLTCRKNNAFHQNLLSFMLWLWRKRFFKWTFLASIRCLQRISAKRNVQMLLQNWKITFWNRLIKFWLPKHDRKKLWKQALISFLSLYHNNWR